MQLLTQFLDPGDAASARRQLREAGIMIEINSVDPHIIQPSKSGSQRIALWVVFDDQFDDAVKLLQDPGHVPTRIISEIEMDALEAEHETSPRNSSKALLKKSGWPCLGAVLLLLAYILIR